MCSSTDKCALSVADMINMISIEFEPYIAEWVHSAGDPISALAM